MGFGSAQGSFDNPVTEHEIPVKPPTVPDVGYTYVKDVAGVSELFYENDNGVEIQLTTGGVINAAPKEGTYLVVTNHADLTDERAILQGSGVKFSDAGANATFEISSESYDSENKEGSTILAGMVVSVHSSGSGIAFANATDNSLNAVGVATEDILDMTSGETLTDGLITLADWTDATGGVSLSANAIYYLSTTPGMITTTAPITVGNIVQVVGESVSADTLRISLGRSVLL